MPKDAPCRPALLTTALLSFVLSGCASYNSGFSDTAINAPGQSSSRPDPAIQADIDANWSREKQPVLMSVDLTVFQGRALLTGHVSDAKIRAAALAGIDNVAGIRSVIDDIQIAPPLSPAINAEDNRALIRLRSILTFDAAVASENYALQCLDGVVYILGTARDRTELERVLQDAGGVPDVRRIVPYVQISAVPPPAPPHA